MVKLTSAQIDEKIKTLFKGEVAIDWVRTGPLKNTKQKVYAVDINHGPFLMVLSKLLVEKRRHPDYLNISKEEIDFKVHFIFEGLVSINWEKSELKTVNDYIWAIDSEYGEWNPRMSELLKGCRHRLRYDNGRKLTKEAIDKKIFDKFSNEVSIDWKRTGELKNTKQKVVAVDSIYGPYSLVLMKLLRGQPHPQKSRDKMAAGKRLSVKEIDNRIKKLHHGKVYIDWSKSPKYTDNSQIVTAVDSKFGPWKISILKLLAGQRHRENTNEERRWTPLEVDQKVKEIFEGEVTINWDKTGEINNREQKIWAIDSKWGEWEVRLGHLLGGSSHPKKYSSFSKGELEMVAWLKSLNFSVQERNRFVEDNNRRWEMDMFVPSHNLGVEYHGLYWHTEDRQGKKMHSEKYQFSKKRRINLFQIYENEWQKKRSAVESIILRSLGKVKKVKLNRLQLKEVSIEDGRKFIENNCLKNSLLANQFLGFYDKNKLVSVLAFKNKSNNLEIVSYCLLKGFLIEDGFNALLGKVIKKMKVTQIHYLLDLRYENDNLLKKLGFYEKNTKIAWKWTNGKQIYESNHFKSNMDYRRLTAAQYAKEAGFLKIYDAGQVHLIKEIAKRKNRF